MSKDYLGILHDVVEETINNEQVFNKAKKQSLKILESVRQETVGVILLSLYLTVIALIDCVELKSENELYYS